MKAPFVYLCLLFLGSAPILAQIETEKKEQPVPWYDSSHSYVVHQANTVAEWMDTFFGNAHTEEEAPYSILRLRLEYDWDEGQHPDFDVKLRGKIYLPNLNKRLSLLFSDDDSDRNDDLLIDDQDKPDDISLQYTVQEKKRYRIDIKLGLKSSGDPKVSARYRYKQPFSKTVFGEFSEELRYRGGEGFGSRTRVDFDKILTESMLLQLNNKVDWSEGESGISWDTSLSLNKRLNEKRAVSYYVSLAGDTQPYGLTTHYGLGLRIRQNIFRPWLFIELQPSYRWQKTTNLDDRQGLGAVLFRIEAVFEKDFSQ